MARDASQGEYAVVALGANLGDAAAQVLSAMDELDVLTGQAVLRSGLWESTPMDCPPGSPRFINAVAAFLPPRGEGPAGMLNKLKVLERKHGRRQKEVLNEPRPLDLDIIAWGRSVVKSADLQVPHPRTNTRLFVLLPLAEILPGWTCPVSGLGLVELTWRAPKDPWLRRWEPPILLNARSGA